MRSTKHCMNMVSLATLYLKASLKRSAITSYLVPYLDVVGIPGPLNAQDRMGNFVVVLDHVQDHGNIGTIIRTASAFGIRDLISTTPTLDIFYKKIVSASRGRVFDMHVKKYATGSETNAHSPLPLSNPFPP
jgi:RNA methyltransferase, TrmH family